MRNYLSIFIGKKFSDFRKINLFNTCFQKKLTLVIFKMNANFTQKVQNIKFNRKGYPRNNY